MKKIKLEDERQKMIDTLNDKTIEETDVDNKIIQLDADIKSNTNTLRTNVLSTAFNLQR
jgi:hypothetical protein